MDLNSTMYEVTIQTVWLVDTTINILPVFIMLGKLHDTILIKYIHKVYIPLSSPINTDCKQHANQTISG